VQIVNSTGKYQNRYQGGTNRTPDISHNLMFYWFAPVLYLDLFSKFLESTERPGYFVGFADNVGDALTFKIWKMTWSQSHIEMWLDSKQMPVIRIIEQHLSQMYKNHWNFWILSQVLFGKIVIISINQERLVMMCQTGLGLRQITHTSILTIELGLTWIT
jgi:hypothetical protein